MFKYNIRDIRLNGRQGFLLRDINLSVLDIETSIKDHPVRYLEEDPGSNISAIPSIVLPFWFYIFNTGRIPTEDQMFHLFKSMYVSDGLGVMANGPVLVPDSLIHQRIYRAFPSLIRDVHFFFMLADDYWFDKVVYSVDKDMNDRVDVVIEKGGRQFAIAMFAGTDKAHNWTKRRKLSTQYTYLPISAGLDDSVCRRVGKYVLYSYVHVEFIRKSISTIIQIDHD